MEHHGQQQLLTLYAHRAKPAHLLCYRLGVCHRHIISTVRAGRPCHATRHLVQERLGPWGTLMREGIKSVVCLTGRLEVGTCDWSKQVSSGL